MVRIGLLFKDEFYHIIDEVFEYLASQRNNINEMSGWHQFLESGKIGNIATAQTLILHTKYDRQISDLDLCLSWFRADKRQIIWQGETISGWSYLSSGPAVPCVEPTCWVYLAYQASSTQETQEVELDVHTFLKATKIPSQHGISWGFVPWTEPRVSPTCIAIRVLSKIHDQSLVSDAIRWLLVARDSQNAWGPTARSSATLTHTALAIFALREAGYNPYNPVLQDGYAFLAKRLGEWMANKQSHTSSEDNMAFVEIIDVPPFSSYEHRPTRIQYFYNPLLLSAIALSSNSEKFLPYIEAVAIEAIRNWSITRWKHPLLIGHQYVTSWFIFDHLSALEPFRLRWFSNKKCLVVYVLSSRGATRVRIGRLGNVLLIFRSRRVVFFFRLVILIAVLLLLAHYVLGKVDVKSSVISVIIGVIANIAYAYLKKVGYLSGK